MTICKFCNGRGYVYNALGNFYEDCGRCQGTGKVRVEGEPLTNEEWIKQANTEQLADVLHKIFMTKSFCHICPENNDCDIGYECKYHGGKTEDFVEWLKQPHTIKE